MTIIRRLLSSVFFKKYVIRVAALLIIVFLPEIVVPVAFHFYKDAFYGDVVASLDQVVNDEPYCIIVPRVKQQLIPAFFIFPERIYSSRKWVIVMDPAKIDYRHILDHAIRQEWLFYAKEERLVRRCILASPRKMLFMFGVLRTGVLWNMLLPFRKTYIG